MNEREREREIANHVIQNLIATDVCADVNFFCF